MRARTVEAVVAACEGGVRMLHARTAGPTNGWCADDCHKAAAALGRAEVIFRDEVEVRCPLGARLELTGLGKSRGGWIDGAIRDKKSVLLRVFLIACYTCCLLRD